MKDNKQVKALLIDDHPMIIDGYKLALNSLKSIYWTFADAFNADDAIRRIKNSLNTGCFDIVFIDIQIPPSSDGTILDGIDLSNYIKEFSPQTKIIILTMFAEHEKLTHILKMASYNAVLVKSDIVKRILIRAVENVLSGGSFFSETIGKLRSIIPNPITEMDELDGKILYHIANGVRTMDLTHYIPLSLSAIEKRKRKIKLLLDCQGGDKELIEIARNKGLV